MSATPPPVEQIPDEDTMNRLIEEPTMYRNSKELIWDMVFQFPRDRDTGETFGESLIWSKYAPTPAHVHKLGCERESSRRASRPNVRYVGLINAQAGKIRQLKTGRGHGFSVVHVPDQGIYHAEVRYQPAPGGNPLNKGDKSELKFMLRQSFGELQPHSCAA